MSRRHEYLIYTDYEISNVRKYETPDMRSDGNVIEPIMFTVLHRDESSYFLRPIVDYKNNVDGFFTNFELNLHTNIFTDEQLIEFLNSDYYDDLVRNIAFKISALPNRKFPTFCLQRWKNDTAHTVYYSRPMFKEESESAEITHPFKDIGVYVEKGGRF